MHARGLGTERRFVVGLVAAVVAAALAVTLPGFARSATTSGRGGAVQFGGRPVFPIELTGPPPLGSQTPWGTDALAETAAAGVDVYSVGTGATWTPSDIASALTWDRAAAAKHVYTRVNLGGYAQATPGSAADAGLTQVVDTLIRDPSGSAIAFWKGRDEPWWSSTDPSSLKFAYCRVTSRGDPSWCGNEPGLASAPLWVTIEAPRGTGADLAPYSAVTDVHGVDIYPVTLNNPSPDLHKVGSWTATIASISPHQPVWTTLQICSSGSHNDATGAYVLPTFQQERYMAYDAIVNGADALAFYGGNLAGCWSPTDAQFGWNWTFWQTVLKPLVEELSASSPIEPALTNPQTSEPIATNDATSEAVLRQGTSVDDIWLIAARSGPGTKTVTFKGLPSWVHRGSVYSEDRTVTASASSFHDRFGQWDAHVYHFIEPLKLQAVEPARATVGSRVVLTGHGLAAATSVSFAGANARFRIASDHKLIATVPRRARSGPVVVTSALAHTASPTQFQFLPS
jgi:hypothetical protein